MMTEVAYNTNSKCKTCLKKLNLGLPTGLQSIGPPVLGLVELEYQTVEN